LSKGRKQKHSYGVKKELLFAVNQHIPRW